MRRGCGTRGKVPEDAVRRPPRRPSPPGGHRRGHRDCHAQRPRRSAACCARHSRNAASSAATRPAAACRKSPNTTRRCAPVCRSTIARRVRSAAVLPARQRHAAGAECRGLSQMHVGHEQRAPARPVQCACGKQLDPLSAEFGNVHTGDIGRGATCADFEFETGSWHDGRRFILNARRRRPGTACAVVREEP